MQIHRLRAFEPDDPSSSRSVPAGDPSTEIHFENIVVDGGEIPIDIAAQR